MACGAQSSLCYKAASGVEAMGTCQPGRKMKQNPCSREASGYYVYTMTLFLTLRRVYSSAYRASQGGADQEDGTSVLVLAQGANITACTITLLALH